MCLAILKPADQHITRKQLRKGFQENPDGAGFMYVGRGRLRIKKGYFTFKGFYKSLRTTEKMYPKSNFVIHFRLSTSGKIDYTNCHPFFIDKQTGFVHNGIFKNMGNKTISDTVEFNSKILQKLSKDFIYNAKILEKIDKRCGWSNKLIFLNNKNDYYIVNECIGKWENNIWYSTYDTPEYRSATSDQWFDREKYEDESVAWDTCDKCGGYYPVNELVELANGNYHCLACSATQYKNPHYCYYCGNAYILKQRKERVLYAERPIIYVIGHIEMLRQYHFEKQGGLGGVGRTSANTAKAARPNFCPIKENVDF